MSKDKLIVALDVDSMEEVDRLVLLLKDEVGMFKVGMQVYHSLGSEVISRIKGQGGRIFLDLKLHDIPNTVAQAARVLTGLGVDMINVHASGGPEMMRQASRAVREEADRLGIKKPLLIAVTILTSLSAEDTQAIGYRDDPDKMVARLGLLTKEAGLDGVVCSPQEADIIRQKCGPDFVSVTPGIRPSQGDQADQKRVMTPKRALEMGAHYLVVGRPIRQADDPVQAARAIVKEMEEANAK